MLLPKSNSGGRFPTGHFVADVYDTVCETMSIMRHYAIRKKSQIFQLFDQGKRPSDIGDASVTRKTLYQYFGEWRKEKGIPAKRTGFALKKFDRKEYLQARERDKQRKERETVLKFVMDWESILDALKMWDGNFEHTGVRIYLRGSRSFRWLRHVLRLRKDPLGKSLYMTREENLALYQKWVELGGKAQDRTDFKKLCRNEGVGLPSELV